MPTDTLPTSARSNSLANLRKGNTLEQRQHTVIPLEEYQRFPLEYHTDRLRYQSAQIAGLVGDDLKKEASRKGKKDFNLLRNLAITFGILIDKATQGSQNDSLVIRFPKQALDSLKIGVAIQLKQHTNSTLNASPSDAVIDISDLQPNALDPVSNDPSDPSL